MVHRPHQQMRIGKMQFAQWRHSATWLHVSAIGAVCSNTAQCTSTCDNTVKFHHDNVMFNMVMPSLHPIFVISKQYSSQANISDGQIRVTSLCSIIDYACVCYVEFWL